MGESVGETRLALSRSPVKLRFWAHESSAYYSLNFCICLGKYKIKVKIKTIPWLFHRQKSDIQEVSNYRRG